MSDSGGGFDPRSKPRGIGLSNMRRVEAVGAVTITSNEGHDLIVRGPGTSADARALSDRLPKRSRATPPPAIARFQPAPENAGRGAARSFAYGP
jgi:hypothetical protein